MRILLLALTVAVAPPPTKPRPPMKMGVELTLAPSAKVLIELPAPDVGDQFKVLTAEQFRRHVRYIVWAEYELTYIRVEGMEILEARFTLSNPKKKSDGHHVSSRPERLELSACLLRDGARGVCRVADREDRP